MKKLMSSKKEDFRQDNIFANNICHVYRFYINIICVRNDVIVDTVVLGQDWKKK
jgi:hypothetical protein